MPTNSGNAFANSLSTLCHQLRLNWTEIATRLSAGQSLSPINSEHLYNKWLSVEQAYEGHDFALKAAELLAATPSHPALLACLCSPNLSVALERFVQVVPEAGLSVESAEDQVRISFNQQHSKSTPQSLQIAILGYVVAVMRKLADKSFRPLQVSLPAEYSGREAAQTFFGVVPDIGEVSLTVPALPRLHP